MSDKTVETPPAVSFVDLKEWCKDIIYGVGGMNAYIRYELGGHLGTNRVIFAVEWALRCLVQPKARRILDVLINESDKRIESERNPELAEGSADGREVDP